MRHGAEKTAKRRENEVGKGKGSVKISHTV
jgi:hypothetical protein